MAGSSTPSDAAIGKLRTAMTELTAKQFDQLIVFLHRELATEATVDFVPADVTTPIDLEVTTPYLFGTFQYGIRLEQVDPNSTIDASVIHEVVAAVDEIGGDDRLHAGTVVTTGEFSSEAETVAAEHGVPLIDGQNLASLLVTNEVGVEERDGRIVLDEEFWELLRGQTRADTVPSIEIPQADSIERLVQTLSAVAEGNHDKAAIASAVESISGDSFDSRQADYYGTAGWLLGFLHKDLESRQVSGRGRWGLTRLGRTYLTYRDQGKDKQANALLHEQIRDIEIVRRILLELQQKGSMQREAVTQLVGEESELSGSTVPRRTRTIVKWLELLPEIEVTGRGSSQQLRYGEDIEAISTGTTTDASSVDTNDPAVETNESTAPVDEDSILDRIMASFEK